MFAVCVTFILKPEHTDAFLVHVKKNAAASLADEEGCLQFDVCQSAERPHEVFLYERYDSAADFAFHQTTDHYRIFGEASAGMDVSKTVLTYETVTPAGG